MLSSSEHKKCVLECNKIIFWKFTVSAKIVIKNGYILVRFVCWAGHRWVECFCQRRSVSSFVLSETLRSAAQCVSVGTQVRTHTTKHIMRCHSPKPPCQASFLQRHCVLRYRFHYLVFLDLSNAFPESPLSLNWFKGPREWNRPALLFRHSKAVRKASHGFVYF